jgi:tRNA intron endonuclease
VKATFDGTSIRTGPDGISLYEQSGYGRTGESGLTLSVEEALYLIQRGKLDVEGYDFDSLLMQSLNHPETGANFLRSFIVYRDIRERGYVIQPGPHDFRVFRRGQRPGKGTTQYLIRVLSERDPVAFPVLIREVATAEHMRKNFLLAVVDDEEELTYYDIRFHRPKARDATPFESGVVAVPAGSSAMVFGEGAALLEKQWFGTRLDQDRLILSPPEVLYLLDQGTLTLSETTIDRSTYFVSALCSDDELKEKLTVYSRLRSLGYTPRTGYKFGHHFRVYTESNTHSEMLVHAIREGAEIPISTISRSVRMAHSVKKKMLFACVQNEEIVYIEFARIKL